MKANSQEPKQQRTIGLDGFQRMHYSAYTWNLTRVNG